MRMLTDYWRPRGKLLTNRPSVDGVSIDLTRLYEEVGRRGGFDKVGEHQNPAHRLRLLDDSNFN